MTEFGVHSTTKATWRKAAKIAAEGNRAHEHGEMELAIELIAAANRVAHDSGCSSVYRISG